MKNMENVSFVNRQQLQQTATMYMQYTEYTFHNSFILISHLRRHFQFEEISSPQLKKKESKTVQFI